MSFTTSGILKIGLPIAAVISIFLVAPSSKTPLLITHGAGSLSDTTKKDSIQYTRFKGLPLKPERKISFSTGEGTWMSIDISPDGKKIAFDLMGDIYTLPIDGGDATPVTKGLAFESHPRFSPDGKKILFTSDRSGSDNIWYIDTEKKDTFQLTKDRTDDFTSAIWTSDGNYIIASKGRRIHKLWMYHKNGGGGIQLNDQPAGVKTIDPFLSADGKTIYFSQRNGSWNYNALLPQYQIGSFDREKGKLSTITTRYGSAFTPTLSKDGQWLAYGSRHEDKTGLILRHLPSGEERWLAYPVQRDEQESIAPLGVLPGMSFTPDSKFLIASYGGKIWKLSVQEGTAPQEIPFRVNVELELGPRLYFNYPIQDTSHQLATQIRDAVPSPDGKKLAFTVLNRLYIMDWPNGTPQRVSQHNFTEAMPAWSPDGSQLAFISWDEKEGGHIFIAALGGKSEIRQLTSESAFYMSPAWSFNNRVVFFRGPKRLFKDAESPFYSDAESEIVWMDPRGGKIQLIDKARNRGNLHFTRDTSRIFLNTPDGSLISMRWDATDEKTHVKVSGITPYGSVSEAGEETGHRRFSMGRNMLDASPLNHCMLPANTDMREPQSMPSPAEAVLMAPSGNKALVKVTNNIYVITIPPQTGKVPSISVADPASSSFPSRQLTEIGGEFPAWELNSNKVHWSLGNGHWTYDVDAAEAFEDSVQSAKKAIELRKADSLRALDAMDKTARAAVDSIAKLKAKSDTTAKTTPKEPKYTPTEVQVKVFFPKDKPNGVVLLKNGRIITMKGNEVIERGDVLIVNNRIVAVGKRGSLKVPAGAKEIDCSGKTLLPGFVDTHAHMWPFWGLHKNQIWIYAANLAYGVTTTRDPQTATTDVLTYSDMVDAGQIVGPRIYSTGPGVGYWAYNLKDLDQTRSVLKQYSKYYNTKTIKMYLVGNRQQRQWVIEAAKEQKLMPTTEGGLDFKLNMTQLFDGYPGHEHALPIFPLYKDVTKSIAEAKMTVTPTLLVSYGGPWAENYYYTTENVYADKKLQYYTPYEELAAKSRRRVGGLGGWFIKDDHVFSKHAQGIKSLVDQGGLAGVGSHGQLQGLGYHWELWSVASGGMSNLQALQVATIHGATAIGLDKDLGSLEAGKLADVLVLDANPLENIRNTNSIRYVIKDGRLYDGSSLDEIYPTPRKLNTDAWRKDGPVVNTGVKE